MNSLSARRYRETIEDFRRFISFGRLSLSASTCRTRGLCLRHVSVVLYLLAMFQSSVTSTLGYNSVILSIEIAFPSVCNAPDARRGSCAKRRIFPGVYLCSQRLGSVAKRSRTYSQRFRKFLKVTCLHPNIYAQSYFRTYLLYLSGWLF